LFISVVKVSLSLFNVALSAKIRRSKMNINKLITTPTKHFESPKEILTTDRLSHKQKKIALENWKQQCVHMQETTAEGMQAKNSDENKISQLKAVNQAIKEL
jgi:hypothetical protein